MLQLVKPTSPCASDPWDEVLVTTLEEPPSVLLRIVKVTLPLPVTVLLVVLVLVLLTELLMRQACTEFDSAEAPETTSVHSRQQGSRTFMAVGG